MIYYRFVALFLLGLSVCTVSAQPASEQKESLLERLKRQIQSSVNSARETKETLQKQVELKKRLLIQKWLRKKTKKWCKEHKTVLGIGSAFALAGLLGGTYQYGASTMASHVLLPATIGSLFASVVYFLLSTDT